MRGRPDCGEEIMMNCPRVMVAEGEKSSRAATTKYYKLGGLTTEIYFLTAVEAHSPRSRHYQGLRGVLWMAALS